MFSGLQLCFTDPRYVFRRRIDCHQHKPWTAASVPALGHSLQGIEYARRRIGIILARVADKLAEALARQWHASQGSLQSFNIRSSHTLCARRIETTAWYSRKKSRDYHYHYRFANGSSPEHLICSTSEHLSNAQALAAACKQFYHLYQGLVAPIIRHKFALHNLSQTLWLLALYEKGSLSRPPLQEVDIILYVNTGRLLGLAARELHHSCERGVCAQWLCGESLEYISELANLAKGCQVIDLASDHAVIDH
jgi:hypothetical protein